MNREFLMLAHTYHPDKYDIGGWYVSIKCDGQRAFWDGGVTRGKLKSMVPWANTEKDGRYLQPPVCTGLWSRYGHVIHAPKWWLDKLPVGVCLDGELYISRGCFQRTRSIVSRLEPTTEWDEVKYLIFESPSPVSVFEDGKINNPQYRNKTIHGRDCLGWFDDVQAPTPYDMTLNRLIDLDLDILPQERLPREEGEAKARLIELLEDEMELGGEGLMLRSPHSYWYPSRSKWLLKVKPLLDSEAIVCGYVWGKGKLHGLMGALGVEWRGVRFFLSGFSDEERELYGHQRPVDGEPCDSSIRSNYFPIGSRVMFRYMTVSGDGLPREARYWRHP